MGLRLIALRLAALFCLLPILAACAGGPIGGSQEALQQSQAAAQVYQLGPGDKVHVSVFGEDNLTGDFAVASDGKIMLPLAGAVQASGLTVPQFQQAIVATLKQGYVQDPHVTVAALDLRPYYILGEINKPGRYAYTPDLTILNAVAAAEGFTYRADMTAIYVRHTTDPSEKEYALTSTMSVQPGDTIRVTQRYF